MYDSSFNETAAARVPTAARNSLEVHRWASIGAMYVSAASMFVMAITGWRAIDAALVRVEVVGNEQRDFSANLVTAIGNLADQTGILTSSDFCPVRFRIRHQGGGVPARTVFGRLQRVTASGDREEVNSLGSTESGVINFGLHPPGSYCLTLSTEDNMTLEHEFDVLPGVPVDRVVISPNGAQHRGKATRVQVVVNWPEMLAAEDLLALIEIEPGPFVTGEWRWEQKDDWPVIAVAATHARFESVQAMIYQLSLGGARVGDSHLEVHSAEETPAPHRYCRIRAITFFQRTLDEQSLEQWQKLGTLVYGGQTDLPGVDGARCCADAGPPPMFESLPLLDEDVWMVEIPQDCVDRLLQWIRESRRSAGLAT